MRRTLFGILVVAAFGCGKPAEMRSGQPFDQTAYEAERGRLSAIERAENEQAMRDHPDAGITPDMARGERERLIQADITRRTEAAIGDMNKTFDKIKESQNLPPPPVDTNSPGP